MEWFLQTAAECTLKFNRGKEDKKKSDMIIWARSVVVPFSSTLSSIITNIADEN